MSILEKTSLAAICEVLVSGIQMEVVIVQYDWLYLK